MFGVIDCVEIMQRMEVGPLHHTLRENREKSLKLRIVYNPKLLYTMASGLSFVGKLQWDTARKSVLQFFRLIARLLMTFVFLDYPS